MVLLEDAPSTSFVDDQPENKPKSSENSLNTDQVREMHDAFEMYLGIAQATQRIDEAARLSIQNLIITASPREQQSFVVQITNVLCLRLGITDLNEVNKVDPLATAIKRQLTEKFRHLVDSTFTAHPTLSKAEFDLMLAGLFGQFAEVVSQVAQQPDFQGKTSKNLFKDDIELYVRQRLATHADYLAQIYSGVSTNNWPT